MTKREVLRGLYAEGRSIEDICLTQNIKRATFYYHRNQDLKEGINWDVLRLQKKRESGNLEEKEAIFLNTLIDSFDRFIESSKSNEFSAEVLEALHRYATTYWRLKAPKTLDAKTLTLKAAQETIKNISEIALEEDNQVVVDFLAKNADRLIAEILKKGQR